MVMRLAIVIVVLGCSSRSSQCADVSHIIDRSVAVFDRQLAVDLPLDVAYVIEISQREGNQTQNETHLSVLLAENGTGIDAAYSKHMKDKASSLYVTIVNPEYGAVATRQSNSLLKEPFALAALGQQRFFLDTYWRNEQSSVEWLQNSVKMKMTSRYFNIGNKEFSQGISEWRSSNGKVDFDEGVGARMLHELRFTHWPIGDEGKMTYRIDPETFAICEIEATFGGIHAKLEVLEFVIFQDVPFPRQTMLTNRQISGKTLVKRSEWRAVAVESVGFKREQLYLPFYGLAHPDLGELPAERRSWLHYYVMFGIIFLFAGWFITKRYRR